MKQIFAFLTLFFLVASSDLISQCVEINPDTQQSYCPDELVILTATPGFDNYNWFYNFNNSNQDGNLLMSSVNENTITLSAAEWALSYIYVEVSDSQCSDPSPTIVWDSELFSSIAIMHDQNTNFCPGDSSLIENAFNGPTNFQWFLDFEPIEDANSAAYWVTTPGTYTLQAAYPQCPDYYLNSGIGPTFEYYEAEIPIIDLQIIDGQSTLVVSSGENIQWYFNGEPLIGNTDTSLIPFTDGAYYVIAVDQNGCTVITEPYQYTMVGADLLTASGNFQVFPNPFEDELTLSSDIEATVIIRIFDLSGKEVSSHRILSTMSRRNVNLGALKSGIYLMEITYDTGGKEVIKLIKN